MTSRVSLDPIQEAYARLSMLEFVLEIVMANQLANAGKDSSDRAKSDLIDRMTKPYAIVNRDVAERSGADQIGLRAAEMTERFVDKVAKREAELREQLSRDL